MLVLYLFLLYLLQKITIMKIHPKVHSILFFAFVSLALVNLTACQSNELTEEEIVIQNAADSEVASLLFAKELDNHASYNIHKDGSVVIKFDRSVSSEKYTHVVDILRASDKIKSVYAEQSGHQVCPLNAIR